jgi:hypothetical protein
MSKWSAYGALTAALGVAVTWLCCLPFAAALGAGVLATGAALSPYQPYLALASFVMLGITFVQTLRSRKCAQNGKCGVERGRGRWIFLVVITFLTILLITFPYWSASLVYWSL